MGFLTGSVLVFSVQFDSNGDGQISLTELREAMKKLMGEQVTNREINEILQDVDLNGDGLVNFEGEGRCVCVCWRGHVLILLFSCFPPPSRLHRVCANDVSLTSKRPPADRETAPRAGEEGLRLLLNEAQQKN